MLRSGLWPVPIERHAKRPIGPAWGAECSTRAKLLSLFERHPGAGVGIALGPAPGVVDFEIDNPATAADLLGRITLPDTLGWASARGEHRVYLYDLRLEGLVTSSVAHLGGAELRCGRQGRQLVSVAPPSVGAGRRRRWNGRWHIAPFPACLLRELERRWERKGPLTGPPTTSGSCRYAEAALRYEVKAVATAAEGKRNTTLNRAAFCLGGLVAAGLLPRQVVEAALFDAAASRGLPEREIRPTLKSGLEAGIRKHRKV